MHATFFVSLLFEILFWFDEDHYAPLENVVEASSVLLIKDDLPEVIDLHFDMVHD